MNDDANPVTSAQRVDRPELPKRFYKSVAAAESDGQWAVLLDGRHVKTPARRQFALARRELAEAVAAEWDAQGERIDPATMPLTRIVNVAIDRVADDAAGVRAEVARYAGSDLVCYRAEGPESLVLAQESAWAPLIAWARATLGLRLVLASGVVHVPQDAAVVETVENVLEPLDVLTLAAVSTVTTLTGSAIIALALFYGAISEEEAWAAAHVDEDWQMARWGRDEEALRKRASRRREMGAAALILKARLSN